MQILVYDLRKKASGELDQLLLEGDIFETSTGQGKIRFSLKTGYEIVLEANETEQRQFAQLIMADLAEIEGGRHAD